jgi:hypothetical protein
VQVYVINAVTVQFNVVIFLIDRRIVRIDRHRQTEAYRSEGHKLYMKVRLAAPSPPLGAPAPRTWVVNGDATRAERESRSLRETPLPKTDLVLLIIRHLRASITLLQLLNV